MKLLGVLGAILSIAAGILIGWAWAPIRTAPFGNTIDIGAVLQAAAGLIGAAATLGVAFSIGLYSSRISSKRADNDLLLQVLGDVKTAFLALHEHSIPCHCNAKLTLAQKSKLLLAEKEVAQAVYSFSQAIGYCGVVADSTFSLEDLKDKRLEVKDSLTDSPYPGPYNESAKQRISKAFRSFRDELNRLSFVITRR